MSDWVAVDWDSVEVSWTDCSVMFACPCGEDVFVDTDGGDKECECGRSYRLACSMQVRLPEKGGEQ